MFQLHTVAPTALHFVDLDDRIVVLDLETLAGLSLEGRDPVSGQRRPDVTVSSGDTIAKVDAGDKAWILTLSSGQTLTVTQARLFAHLDPEPWHVPAQPWTAAEATDWPVYDYTAFHNDEHTQRGALRQLAVRGFVRLSGAPATAGEIETLVKAFGCVRETNYGRLFDVRTKRDVTNLADTALALAPHTDNPYRLAPPEIQVLHCLSAAGHGGRSLLVDGLAVVAALKAEASVDYHLLCHTPVRFAWSDGETFLEATAPVIALNADGMLERLRYNPRAMQQAWADDETVRAAWRGAWDRLGALLAAPAFGVTFDMRAGDMVLMDNRRVLHGRTAFESSGEVVRHLQGGYADMDGVYSTLRRLTQIHVEREIDALEALFESDGLSESYGEDISIRDHMLQSAEGAVARRMGPNLVVVALVHDIGWGMKGPHEAAAAAMLTPVLGEGVASLIRNHVDAKRYLVAVRPDYAERLSAASVHTLKQQGGPMTPDQCRAFEAMPDFELCLELRYLDEGGKALSRPVSRFADYRPLLKALMARQALMA